MFISKIISYYRNKFNRFHKNLKQSSPLRYIQNRQITHDHGNGGQHGKTALFLQRTVEIIGRTLFPGDLGVDCLSFGGTKNGMMIGESAIILNPALDVELKYRRKQMAQLSSKMRFMAAQFDAYITTELWRRNAEHSNAMAQLLYREVCALGVKVMYPVQVNSVFVQLPADIWHALQKEYFFYDWDEASNVVRWMCSFDTTEDDIRNFVAALKRLLS